MMCSSAAKRAMRCRVERAMTPFAGGGGADLVLLDVGDDLFRWKPGDASDEVHGEGGTDTARVTGSKANEDFTIVPGGFGSHVLSNALGANSICGWSAWSF